MALSMGICWLWGLVLLIVGVYGGLINENVELQTDFYGPSARLTYRVRIRNDGSDAFDAFDVVIPPQIAQVSRLSVGSKVGEAKKETPLQIEETEVDKAPQGSKTYSVMFLEPLKASEATNVIIRIDAIDQVIPTPKQVKHGERPTVTYKGNAYFFSPYVTETQFGTVQSTDLGPFKDIQPFSTKEFTERFANVGALLKLDTFVKKIAISHWGAAEVEEEMTLRNAGPEIVGHFSRLDQMLMARAGMAINSADNIAIMLPRDARDVYYKDLIGNITTSHLRLPAKRGRYFEPQFRFPLLGGWKIYFWYGYTLPLSSALKHKGNQFVLRFNAQPATFKPVQVSHATFKVTLPEGASNVRVHYTDPSITLLEEETVYPTLSYFGRKTIVLQRDASIADLSLPVPVNIIYDFSLFYLIRPALVLMTGILLFFTVIIALSHLDLSLSIDQTGRDVDLALYVAIKELIKTETELSKLYDEVTEAIRNYSSKDQTGGFKQTLSACWEKVKAKESDIEDHVRVINKLDAIDKSKCSQLVSIHRVKRENLQKLGMLATELVEGRTTQARAEADASKINEMIDSCDQRVNITLSNLSSHI